MASARGARRRKFMKWLFVVTGLSNGSFFLMIASMTKDSVATWRAMMGGIPFLLFVVTLALLPVAVVWGAWKQRVTKTEAWWWLSVPFVIVFQLSLFIKLDNVEDATLALAPLSLLYFIGALSSGSWAIVTAYEMKNGRSIQNEKLMLVLAVIAAIPWMFLHRVTVMSLPELWRSW